MGQLGVLRPTGFISSQFSNSRRASFCRMLMETRDSLLLIVRWPAVSVSFGSLVVNGWTRPPAEGDVEILGATTCSSLSRQSHPSYLPDAHPPLTTAQALSCTTTTVRPYTPPSFPLQGNRTPSPNPSPTSTSHSPQSLPNWLLLLVPHLQVSTRVDRSCTTKFAPLITLPAVSPLTAVGLKFTDW